jgi:hypothetical protein
MKFLLFMVFVNVYIYFQIWSRIRNPRVTDPSTAKVPDQCGSGSTTLILPIYGSIVYSPALLWTGMLFRIGHPVESHRDRATIINHSLFTYTRWSFFEVQYQYQFCCIILDEPTCTGMFVCLLDY